jgi:diguanylate cyclase (GGDEF)-like protein
MAISDRALEEQGLDRLDGRLDSYRRLAETFHLVLSEQSLESLLERVADTLSDLIPYDTLTVYQASEAEHRLIPVLARDQWAEEILNDSVVFGEGLTGWAVENRTPILANEAHLDSRVKVVPGTPLEPEAIICLPLISRNSVQGALNIYRIGPDEGFSEAEFELAKRFGDAVALALDNAQARQALERLAQTDSLTGVYNHRYFYERLKAELTRASRTHDSVSVMMLDIDDFKRLNDVYGHGVGDEVLIGLAGILQDMVRASDTVCRLGGEEFAVVLPSCEFEAALGLASRIQDSLSSTTFDPAGRVSVSIGVSQGPLQAMNPRELVACAEAAMMTAKARGKDRVVVFSDNEVERPGHSFDPGRDVRWIAHLKMLQSLTAKLNQLSGIKEITNTIADELRTLIDYHNCRVYVAENELLIPVAFRGELAAYAGEAETPEILTCAFGEGIAGTAALRCKSLLIENALECEFALDVPGTEDIEESMIAVPLSYGARVIGVIVISKLGVGQFDEDDLRLIEVLAGTASVALENARLYESQRREAETAKALLLFSDAMAKAPSLKAITEGTVKTACELLEAHEGSLWLQEERTGDFRCKSHLGYAGKPALEALIDFRIPGEGGLRLLEHRDGPFVLSPKQRNVFFEFPRGVEQRVAAIAPLIGLNGFIVVRQPTAEGVYFTTERLQVLRGLSNEASQAMQRVLSYEAQEESAEVANALLEFSRELAFAEGMDVVLARIAKQVCSIVGAPSSVIFLQDALSRDVRVAASWGYEPAHATRLKQLAVSEEVTKPFVSLVEPFVLSKAYLQEIEGMKEVVQHESFGIAPMQMEGGVAGFLAVSSTESAATAFPSRKMRLLAGVADQAKLAISNAASFGNLELTFLSTVEALANALEAKDEYTSSHARWITDMSLEVGKELGLAPNELKHLELGALFHDIGKIGIPHSILLKPGPLSQVEWQVIKTHPEVGERILAPIGRLAAVRPIVRHCHERYDGGGYPDGKAGDDIPIESRIIFVCDAFHAMTTDRPYRQRMSIEESCRRLRANAGTQFDPEVVEVFIGLVTARPDLALGI